MPGPPPKQSPGEAEPYELADDVAAPEAPTEQTDPPKADRPAPQPNAQPAKKSGSADLDAKEPPRRGGSGVTALLLLIALAVAAIPLLLNLGRTDVTDPQEAIAVARALHSWQRHEVTQSSFEVLIPYYNAERRLERAPGAYWLAHLTMLTMENPAADLDHLVLRLRITSAIFGLLTLAAIFWIGCGIGGKRAGFLAAAVCAASPLFIHHARLAAPMIYHLGFAALAIGAAVWAIRPLKPAASTERQLIGWVICGLSLGAAALSAGPIVAVTVVCPILLIMLLCEDRVGHLMGLLAALFMGVLLVLPWALYAHEQEPDVWQHWFVEMTRGGTGDFAMRAVIFVAAIAPWTLWALIGILQPISTSSKGRRVRLLLGSTWFIAVSVVLLATGGGDPWRHLAPAVVPAAVLVGQLFNHYTDLAASGRFARNWRWVRWPHVLLMIAASIALPPALYAEGAPTFDGDAISNLLSDTRAMLLPAGWIVALLAVTAFGARWTAQNFPDRAAATWSVWSIVLICAAVTALTAAPIAANPLRENAARLQALVGEQSVYFCGTAPPDPLFTVYADRELPTVQSLQMRQAIRDGQSFYLLTPTEFVSHDGKLTHVATLARAQLKLWRHEASHE